MARKRRIEVFSLSFLDCISCGFGAVVLLFVIINSQVNVRAGRAGAQLQGETDRIDELVLEGRKNLVRLRTALADQTEERAIATAEARRIEEMLKTLRAQLAASASDSSARKASIALLEADIRQLEEANRRLAARASREPASGERIRSFTGEGNRQYLTGVRMGGERVLILLDASASMLGRTYVNVVRFRSMPEARRRAAPKWQQAVRTVDWLSTRIKPGTRMQIYVFDETARSVVDGTDGRWIEVRDGTEVGRAIAAVRQVVPQKGTSLANAFEAMKRLDPAPDNIFLITDGLPTQGQSASAGVQDVPARQRANFMAQALRLLPRRIPVNVILLPMDGDPDAAGYFWQLAVASGGSLLTPARDWP